MPTEISSFAEAIGADRERLTFNCGIEREALRVTPAGKLSQQPHPAFLGSKLTHPKITTDFSEAQMELITPVHQSADAALADLHDIHRFIYTGLGEEILWSASMPCVLQDDSAIPLAYYGKSNLGRLKTAYRHGLGVRYGRGMQTISAVHYNFSFPDVFWQWLQKREGDSGSQVDFQTRRYFDLMRNFRRYSWLLTYLFGASPAVCNSFLKGREHNLQPFGEGTAYLPYATSLRSGRLGYQSDTQSEQVRICYNSLDNYVHTLADAITTSYPAYEDLGLKEDNQYRQVNTSILQSEAEFYSSIRAKRVPPPGANFLATLLEEGVQYIEVRLLDVNPYEPTGINAEALKFIDTFLLYCLLTDSPAHDDEQCAEVAANTQITVREGRHPDLTLHDQGRPRLLRSWATDITSAMREVASMLDRAQDTTDHIQSLANQELKISDDTKTPSGAILADMTREGIPYFRFAMNQALAHRERFLGEPLSEAELSAWQQLTDESIRDQQAIEASDTIDFATYLARMASGYERLRSGS